MVLKYGLHGLIFLLCLFPRDFTAATAATAARDPLGTPLLHFRGGRINLEDTIGISMRERSDLLRADGEESSEMGGEGGGEDRRRLCC